MSEPTPPSSGPGFTEDVDLPTGKAIDPLSVTLTPEQREARRAARKRRREARQRAQQRRRRRRILLIVSVVLALIAALVFAWVRWTTGGLERIPVAMSNSAAAPGKTFLLVGSDPAAGQQPLTTESWRNDLTRGDLVMVVHVSADGRAMYAVSIPHDLVLPLPDGTSGLLSTAASGGPSQYLAAVQQLIGVPVDHLAVLNLNGLREVVDHLGGITVTVPAPICADQPGTTKLDGQGTLDFIRMQPCFPRGDLDRVQRQQAVLKATLASFVNGGSLANPFRLNRMARSMFSHLAVEDGWSLWSMARLAWSLRNIGPARTTFLTVPVLDNTADKSRVRLDEPAAAQLWQALRTDTIGAYLQLNDEAAVLGQ